MRDIAPLLRVRDFLEPRWIELKQSKGLHPGRPASFGMCRLGAGFLARHLNAPTAFKTGAPVWRQQGKHGGFYGPGGYEAPVDFIPENEFCRDRWQHHSWLEFDGLIVDITADQFGADIPRAWAAVEDDRYAANSNRVENQAAWIGGAYSEPVTRWLAEAEEAPEFPTPNEIVASLIEVRDQSLALTP